MTVQLSSAARVTQKLFDKFYIDGKVNFDQDASSHWLDFSKNITARFSGKNLHLHGYGFGESERSSLLAKLISWLSVFLHLRKLSDWQLSKRVKKGKKIVNRMGLQFSLDAFRQLATLNLLKKYIQPKTPPSRILIIGDGHGILSALIHAEYPQSQIILVDLGAVLLFQSYYLNKAFPESKQSLVDEGHDKCSDASFVFCPSSDLRSLALEFDLAINIASMQEMNPLAIASYFDFLRKSKTQLFYCCNRLEKLLVGGEITRFMDYPWVSSDIHLIDEMTPWHQWFIGLGWSSSNMKWRGIPIPFIYQYDGPHWHRLTKFKAL
jgi:hypothetical protein